MEKQTYIIYMSRIVFLRFVSWLPATQYISCLCLTADLKVIYVHDLLKIVGNSVSNVQIAFISSDLLRSSLFGITCLGSFRYLTLACKHL